MCDVRQLHRQDLPRDPKRSRAGQDDVSGMVEAVLGGERPPFHTMQELWRIIVSAKTPTGTAPESQLRKALCSVKREKRRSSR